MPLLEISEEQAKTALAAMADALDSLLIENEVPKEVRAILGHLGVRRLNNMANYESNEEAFREAVVKDLGIVPTEAQGRVLISNLIECWKSARNRLKTRDDEAAVARAQGRPAPLPEDLFISMRRSWESVHGEVEDRNFPSKYFTNRRFRQLESGELRAERLSEVTSVEEGGDEEDDRELDLIISGTSFRATRKYVSVALPGSFDTEALRHRILLMKRHWDLVVSRFGDKRALMGYDREIWTRHIDYILGERIYGYRACGLRLGWSELLEYEWQIRHSALKRVNRGEATLCEALTAASNDADLKQLHFTLPLSTMGKRETAGKGENKRGGNDNGNSQIEQELKKLRSEIQGIRQSASSSSSGPQSANNNSTFANQQRTKGKTKGKGKSGKDQSKMEKFKTMREKEKIHNHLPNGGGVICYFYNLGSCNRGRDCKFHHTCMRCLKDGHTIFECREAPVPK